MSRVAAKICGLSTAEAVESAVTGGAGYVGFVFYEPSPRNLSPAKASALASAIPSGIKKVAVMVDPDDELIGAVTAQVPVDLLQLHGKEDTGRIAAIKRRFGVPVMKAVPIAQEKDLARGRKYEQTVDMLLFDAKPAVDAEGALPGGNALAFDWTLLRGQSWDCPWGLSGGLTAANVADAVSVSGAPMVDVSSGVESRPGHKEPELIAGFLAAVAAIGN